LGIGDFNYVTRQHPDTSLHVKGDISASGNLHIDGKLTATEYHTFITSASIIFASGSTQFGDSTDDTHQFIGNITSSGDLLKTKFAQMTNSSSVIDTFNKGNFRSAKYVLQVTSGSHIQSSEMLVMQNSSNAFNTEYAQINSGLNLVNFSSKVNTERGTVELIGSSSFISCSVKFVRTLI